jgi:hypothetical protein
LGSTSEAREYFNSSFPVHGSTISSKNGRKPDKNKPDKILDWSKAVQYMLKGKELVEVPISYEGLESVHKVSCSLFNNHKGSNFGVTKMLFIKQNGRTISSLMIKLNPEEKYFNNKQNKNEIRALTLNSLKKDFSGYLLFTDSNDKVLTTYLYEKGKIIATTSSTNLNKSSKNGRSSGQCYQIWNCRITTYELFYGCCTYDEYAYNPHGYCCDVCGYPGRMPPPAPQRWTEEECWQTGEYCEPDPEIPTETEKPKVGINPKSEECKTLRQLWDASLGTNPDGSRFPEIEWGAIFTDKGLLVMPTSGKTAVWDASINNFTQTGSEFSNTSSNSRFDYLGGFLIINNVPYYKTFDGTLYQVYGTIHTHPRTSLGSPQLPSGADRGDRMCSVWGVPQYILGAQGITEYSDQGSLGVKYTPQQLEQCISSLF